jgi:hypothetical protein
MGRSLPVLGIMKHLNEGGLEISAGFSNYREENHSILLVSERSVSREIT